MRSHHGTLSLAPLDRQQVRDMVAELSARHALARDVVEDVAARTGGVPLFVEEVTRLLLERGEGGGGIQAIPPTLQQSLMARNRTSFIRKPSGKVMIGNPPASWAQPLGRKGIMLVVPMKVTMDPSAPAGTCTGSGA